mmetsp:Transcript_49455/g.122935  ORF Transcript_49455/g.122935 Transcript_49455/m.122935 type:complete len:88 (-) Transcript_49455:273-536(-)
MELLLLSICRTPARAKSKQGKSYELAVKKRHASTWKRGSDTFGGWEIFGAPNATFRWAPNYRSTYFARPSSIACSPEYLIESVPTSH